MVASEAIVSVTVSRLVRKLHLYLAFSTGLLLVVIGLSGSAVVFGDELERWWYPQLYAVQAAPDRFSLEQSLRSIKAHTGRTPITNIELPRAASDPLVFYAETDHDEFERWFVDPYNGEILGRQSPYENPLGFLLLLHTHLLAGETGEILVGVTGFVSILLLLTGVYMWWPGLGRVLRSLRIRCQPPGFWSELHKVFGVLTVPTLALASITGSALIFYTIAQAFALFITASPARATIPTIEPPGAGAQRLSLDQLLAIAERTIPAGVSTFLHIPQQASAPLAVRKRLPEEAHRNGRTFVYLNPYTAEVVHIDHALRASAGVRALNLLYPLHTGDAGGLWLRVSYVLTGLMPAWLLTSGFIIWWRRRALRRAPYPRIASEQQIAAR
jgi:uncharacterized iron-regulated membrane protein